MASRLFQSIILQMKDTVDRTIGIVDATGAVVACTDLPRIGEMREDAVTELGYAGDMIRFGGYTYRSVADRSTRFEYAVFVQGEDELARSICSSGRARFLARISARSAFLSMDFQPAFSCLILLSHRAAGKSIPVIWAVI